MNYKVIQTVRLNGCFYKESVSYLCLMSNLADTEFVVDTVGGGELVLVKMSIAAWFDLFKDLLHLYVWS